jgi:hypothetical protein
MSKHALTAAEIYEKVQRKVEKSMRENQTTQNFFGTLKVNLDNIYVTQADGERAIKELKRLSE